MDGTMEWKIFKKWAALAIVSTATLVAIALVDFHVFDLQLARVDGFQDASAGFSGMVGLLGTFIVR
jgi:hypothetical protein